MNVPPLKGQSDFLIFGSFLIAAGASCQGLLTYLLIGIKPDPVLIIFMFSATLSVYNLSITRFKGLPPGDGSHRQHVIGLYHTWFRDISVFSALATIPLMLHLRPGSIAVILFLAILSFLYTRELIPFQGKKRSLRQIPGFKSVLIACIWTLTTVWIPVYENPSINPDTILALLASRFCFIAAASIAFDIRDITRDLLSNIKSIPVLFSAKTSTIIAVILLALSTGLILSGLATRVDLNELTKAAFLTTFVLQAILILRTTAARSDYYFFFFLDGVFILQYLLALAGKNLTPY